jgi:hypothetical protein
MEQDKESFTKVKQKKKKRVGVKSTTASSGVIIWF